MIQLADTPKTSGAKSERVEFRVHPDEKARIENAAEAVGLKGADFIRHAILLQAREIEERSVRSVLPTDAFEAFQAAVDGPGEFVPGLAAAAEKSKGLLIDG